MKNLKKLIALIAVLALTLSTVALGATYSDVAEDSAYSVAVESLSKLGIVTGYEDGTYGPEKAVTRAEMAALIARIQGYEETAKGNTTTVFTDVPADYWASGYVALASNMGIVNGYGDGTFGPDDSVKYEQAVTMIMRTLGYEPFAASNGGYPTGYLAAAQRYGLVKGVSNAVSGTDANRGTIAQLLYNGIDTPIMAQSKWGTDGDIEYTIYDGVSAAYKTLMSENLGVVKVKGIVDINATTNLNSGSKTIDTTADPAVHVTISDVYDTTNTDFLKNDKIVHSGEFLTGDSDIADFLGYRVIFYVMEDEATDKYVVISCAKDTATNDTVSFTLDQYAGISTSDKKIEYYKNTTDTTTTKLAYESGIQVVYNYDGGRTLTDVLGNAGSSAIIVPDTDFGGMVTLIDNDTTNGYDVAIVEVGVSAVVDEVTSNKVSFKEGASLATGGKSIGSIKIDEDAEDKIIVYTKDGEVISPSDLVEWDVVTIVTRSADSDVMVVEVIGSTVTGAIGSRKSSDTSWTTYAYKIDGSYYDVAPNAYKASKLDVGEAGIFYLDKYGKIVAYVEDATVAGGTAKNYAYVMEAGEDTAFNKSYSQIRLLTGNGVDIYDVSDEVEINETEYDVIASKDSDGNATVAGAGEIRVADLNTMILGELIQYNVNSAGEIDEIQLADHDADDFATVGPTAAAQEYDADNLILNSVVDADAKVFILVADGAKWNTSESFVGTLADLEDGEKYTAATYLTSKGDDADLIVVTAGYNTAGTSSNVAVLTEVSEGTNDDGDDVYILSYYKDGELVEGIYTSETVKKISGLNAGDIVKVKVSSAGVVTSLTKVVDFAEKIRNKTTGKISATTLASSAGTDEEFVYGYATKYTSSTKTVTVDGKSYKLTSADNIYVIDYSGKNVDIYAGVATDYSYDKDITADFDLYADWIFGRKYEKSVKDIVIIKNVIDDIDYSAVEKQEVQDRIDAADAEIAAQQAIMDTNKTAYDAYVAAEEALTTNKTAYDAYVAAETALEAALTDAEDYITITEGMSNSDIVTALEAVTDNAETVDVNEATLAAAVAADITAQGTTMSTNKTAYDAYVAAETAKTENKTAYDAYVDAEKAKADAEEAKADAEKEMAAIEKAEEEAKKDDEDSDEE